MACVALGTSPRLAALLTRIPLAVHGACPLLPLPYRALGHFHIPIPPDPCPRAGGVLCVTYAVAVGTGISYFQYADIDSGRNIFIVGFAMFMALLVPRWLGAAPAHLATGIGGVPQGGQSLSPRGWQPHVPSVR